MFDMRAIIK